VYVDHKRRILRPRVTRGHNALANNCRSFVVLYKSIVRSHLEYSECVWNPHHQQLIEKLETVQKRATKLIIAVKLKI